MSRLLIAGAGGHGVVSAEAAELSNSWDQIAFLDDQYPRNTTLDSWPVLGTLSDATLLLSKWPNIIIAIGNNDRRLEIAEQMTRHGFNLADVIHPKATLSPRAQSDGGSVFLAGSIVNARTHIGQCCIINTGATVDHDCILEEGVHISPGANLAANVRVGRLSWIGIGAAVRDGTTIGGNATVGAGAAVVEDVTQSTLVKGVPAR